MYLHLWTKQFIMYNVYDAKQDQDYLADFKGYLSRNKGKKVIRFALRVELLERERETEREKMWILRFSGRDPSIKLIIIGRQKYSLLCCCKCHCILTHIQKKKSISILLLY
jgi:hypothetical protein